MHPYTHALYGRSVRRVLSAVLQIIIAKINRHEPGYTGSTQGIDYVFSHFCGIFLASTVYMALYCAYRRNKCVRSAHTAVHGVHSRALLSQAFREPGTGPARPRLGPHVGHRPGLLLHRQLGARRFDCVPRPRHWCAFLHLDPQCVSRTLSYTPLHDRPGCGWRSLECVCLRRDQGPPELHLPLHRHRPHFCWCWPHHCQQTLIVHKLHITDFTSFPLF